MIPDQLIIVILNMLINISTQFLVMEYVSIHNGSGI